MKQSFIIKFQILNNGLKMHLSFPKVNDLFYSEKTLIQLWGKDKRLSEMGINADFAKMVKYFATPEEKRTPEMVKSILNNGYFFDSILSFLRSKVKQEYPAIHSNFSVYCDSSNNWLINGKNEINIYPLFCDISKGLDFHYKGVYSEKILKNTIIPVYRSYMEILVKKFS